MLSKRLDWKEMPKGQKYTFYEITLTETKRKDGRFMATGRDPITQRPRAFYSRMPGGAAKDAAQSLARIDENTLGAFYLNIFLPTVAMREPAWRYQIKWAWDGYLMKPLAHLPFEKINRPDLQRIFNQLSTRLKPSSARRIKIVLSCILNLAVADGYMVSNPCASIRFAQSEVPTKKALAKEELAALIAASTGSLQNAIVLMAHGLRIGEACGCTLGHIADGSLHVSQQLTQDKGGSRLKAKLKTPQSNRFIPLAPDVEAILRANAGSMFLIPSSNGKPMTPNNVHLALNELLSGLEDVPKVTPHELRHTFITLLENEVEAPQPVVCALAGKKYWIATSGYNHVTPKVLRKWSERYWDEISSTYLTKNIFCQA